MTLTDKDYGQAAKIYRIQAESGDTQADSMRRAFDYLMGIRNIKARQEKDRARYERRKVEAAR